MDLRLAERIRLARRRAGFSQLALAKAVGADRSAVSHWESVREKNPSTEHLREIAIQTGVNFEWLATGRGAAATLEEDIPTAYAILVDDDQEMRLVEAFRKVPAASRVSLVELAEQLARLRSGRKS